MDYNTFNISSKCHRNSLFIFLILKKKSLCSSNLNGHFDTKHYFRMINYYTKTKQSITIVIIPFC